MSERDMVANVNFFSKVIVADDGTISYTESNSRAGDYVELRSEMKTLVILNTCIHPMTTSPTYSPKPILAGIYKVPPPADDDLCRNSCPENGRGFINTERYFM